MKFNKISILAVAGVLTLTACDDVNQQEPAGSMITAEQLTETYGAIESRVDATFSGMFNIMGEPYGVFTSRTRADDFGFIMAALSQDTEGADYLYPNSGYNWFSVCGEYSSRTPNYANPYIRYAICYNQIKIANDIISALGDLEDAGSMNKVAQARAIRAFDYLNLVPYFQFNYQGHQNDPGSRQELLFRKGTWLYLCGSEGKCGPGKVQGTPARLCTGYLFRRCIPDRQKAH